MASTPASKMVPKEKNTPFSDPIRAGSRRTPSSSSFSSTSSSGSLSFSNDTLFSPSTPLRSSGIPFSWEKLPGIPKKQTPENKEYSSKNLLPLPPAVNSIYSKKTDPVEVPLHRKRFTSKSCRRDPFFAALLECSKDDQESIDDYWKGAKENKSFSDRLGLGFVDMYASCKRTCAVSESVIYLPRYKRHDEFNRR